MKELQKKTELLKDIEDYRKVNLMYYSDLASQMGLNYMTVYLILTGKNSPGNKFIKASAKLLNISISEAYRKSNKTI